MTHLRKRADASDTVSNTSTAANTAARAATPAAEVVEKAVPMMARFSPSLASVMPATADKLSVLGDKLEPWGLPLQALTTAAQAGMQMGHSTEGGFSTDVKGNLERNAQRTMSEVGKHGTIKNALTGLNMPKTENAYANVLAGDIPGEKAYAKTGEKLYDRKLCDYIMRKASRGYQDPRLTSPNPSAREAAKAHPEEWEAYNKRRQGQLAALLKQGSLSKLAWNIAPNKEPTASTIVKNKAVGQVRGKMNNIQGDDLAREMVQGGVGAAGKVGSWARGFQQAAQITGAAIPSMENMAVQSSEALGAAGDVASKAAVPLAVAGVAAGAAGQMFRDPATGNWSTGNIGQNLENNANATINNAGDSTLTIDNAKKALGYAAPTEWAGAANAYAGGLGDINAQKTYQQEAAKSTQQMQSQYDKRRQAQSLGNDPRATSPNPYARRAAQQEQQQARQAPAAPAYTNMQSASQMPKQGSAKLPMPKIKFVDGEKVRNEIFPDFTSGGNDMVYPRFVPPGEIWIDKVQKPLDAYCAIVHECIERRHMHAGDDYDTAHGKAIRAEQVVRAMLTGKRPGTEKKV